MSTRRLVITAVLAGQSRRINRVLHIMAIRVTRMEAVGGSALLCQEGAVLAGTWPCGTPVTRTYGHSLIGPVTRGEWTRKALTLHRSGV